jgi:hypothetical protein
MTRFIRGSLCLSFAVATALLAAPAMADPAPPAAEKPQPPPPESVNHPAPNSIYAEGLGAGLAYSINYERMVLDELGVRIGFSYLSISASASGGGETASASASYVMVPITASYTGLRTRGGSGLELGAGATMLYVSGAASALGTTTSGSGMTPLVVAMVGYRLQPVDHAGFMFRVGAMALGGEGLGLSNGHASQFGFIPWPYISCGASF